jgi:hypothetical protein
MKESHEPLLINVVDQKVAVDANHHAVKEFHRLSIAIP